MLEINRKIKTRKSNSERYIDEMAGQRDSSDEESVDYAPFISDTRQYSEFVLFFVNNGRFQHNSLTDSDRRKGVLNLLQAERVVKLTKERRLSPVNLSLTPGGPKQRVYLIAICRSGKFDAELTFLYPLTKP